jgi:prophage tail gpP-like protein
MSRPSDLGIGGLNDTVVLEINGNALSIVESYEIKIAVMTQPAAFTLRLGWGDTARELLKLCPKGGKFKLSIGGVLVQSGIIDGRAVPASDATVVEVKGRDYMRALFNGHVEEDISFKERTYYDVTRKVMDLVGLGDHELVAGNGANRQAVTAVKVPFVPTEEQVRTVETGIASAGGSRMEFKALKAEVSQRWYDWLQDKYKLSGLFLWCAGDGKFILSTPRPNVQPCFILARQRGALRNAVNITSHSWRDDATGRHAKYIVYGRSGGGRRIKGRAKISGEYIDPEMVAAGITDVITYYDNDVDSPKECEYLAKRYASEERRAGWELAYNVAGHSTPSLINDGVAIWGPDNAALVADDELGIEGPHYIESVTFSKKPEMTSRIELIRPEDLLYIAEEDQSTKSKKSAAFAKATTKKTPVADETTVKETDWTQWTWKEDPPPAQTLTPTSIFYGSK